MKKILTVLTLLLVGCQEVELPDNDTDIPDTETPEVEMISKTSVEIMMELFSETGVSVFDNVSVFNDSEESYNTLNNLLSNQIMGDAYELEGLVDGAMSAPMMTIDARNVMVLRMENQDNHTDIMNAMHNISTFRICVGIEEYQVVARGDYLLFAGLGEHQEMVDVFLEMDLMQEDRSVETSFDLLLKLYEDAEVAHLSDFQLFDNDKRVDVSYKLFAEDIEFGFIDAVSNSSMGDFTQYVFLIHVSDNHDEVLESITNLKDTYSFTGEEISHEVAINGDYILFAGSVEKEKLIDAFINLDL